MNTSTNNVKYTGVSDEEVGLRNGQSLETVLDSLREHLKSLKNKSVVLDGETVSVYHAIDILLKKNKELTSSAIKHKSNTNLVQMVNSNLIKELKFELVFGVQGAKQLISYDYTPLSNIYSGVVAKTKLLIETELIRDSSNLKGTLDISVEDLPAFFDIEIRCFTKEGESVILTAVIPIYSSSKEIVPIYFTIKDYSSSVPAETVEDSINMLVSKQRSYDIFQKEIDGFRVEGETLFEGIEGMFSCLSSACRLSGSAYKKAESFENMEVGGLSSRGVSGCFSEIHRRLVQNEAAVTGFLKQLRNNNLQTVPVATYDVPNGACVDCYKTAAAIIPVERIPVFYIQDPSLFVSAGNRVVVFVMSDLDPVLLSLEEVHGKYKEKASIGFVTLERDNKVFFDYGVKDTPTIIIFKNGVEYDRLSDINTLDYKISQM